MAEQRIFFSFTRDESPFVRSVADALRQHGVDLWLDADAVQAGDAFAERFSEGLRASSLVVVFLGKTADSPWLNFEIGAALGQGKQVFPVFLHPVGRTLAPPAIQKLSGIDASNLKPEQVAEHIAAALRSAGPATNL